MYTETKFYRLTIFIMPCKGKSFPGRGFSSGAIMQRKRARKAFGGSVLNKFRLLTMHTIKTKSNAGLPTMVG